MLKRIVGLLGFITVAILTLGAIFLIGMRKNNALVVDSVRRINRGVMNPKQMESAGTPGAYASIIRHVGRVSGKNYETPVGAVPTGDGFIIALPYGSRADWLKNVLNDGGAVIVTEGETHEVESPELIPLEEAAAFLSAEDQRMHKIFGVDQALRVRTA
jgi:deazaflavin-dependent oxidoreductase (nitroreductase family)